MKNQTLIIAEAGVYHNGAPALIKQLIYTAAKAGADLVNSRPSAQTARSRALL
jgi:sialic acid synthase SpsE